jgi:hypothetical protein
MDKRPQPHMPPEMYSKVCTVTADISSVLRTLPTLTMANGRKYMHLECFIELLFGSTEYKARLVWEENVSLCSFLVVTVN